MIVQLHRAFVPRLGERVDVLRFLRVRRGLKVQVRIAERVRVVVPEQRTILYRAAAQFQRK